MAKVTKFTSSFGMSLDIQNVWHKFHCGIEIEIEEGDNIEEVKKKAHNTVHLEVEKQIQKAIDAYSDVVEEES